MQNFNIYSVLNILARRITILLFICTFNIHNVYSDMLINDPNKLKKMFNSINDSDRIEFEFKGKPVYINEKEKNVLEISFLVRTIKDTDFTYWKLENNRFIKCNDDESLYKFYIWSKTRDLAYTEENEFVIYLLKRKDENFFIKNKLKDIKIEEKNLSDSDKICNQVFFDSEGYAFFQYNFGNDANCDSSTPENPIRSSISSGSKKPMAPINSMDPLNTIVPKRPLPEIIAPNQAGIFFNSNNNSSSNKYMIKSNQKVSINPNSKLYITNIFDTDSIDYIQCIFNNKKNEYKFTMNTKGDYIILWEITTDIFSPIGKLVFPNLVRKFLSSSITVVPLIKENETHTVSQDFKEMLSKQKEAFKLYNELTSESKLMIEKIICSETQNCFSFYKYMIDPIPSFRLVDEKSKEYNITIDLQKILLQKNGSLYIENINDEWYIIDNENNKTKLFQGFTR